MGNCMNNGILEDESYCTTPVFIRVHNGSPLIFRKGERSPVKGNTDGKPLEHFNKDPLLQIKYYKSIEKPVISRSLTLKKEDDYHRHSDVFKENTRHQSRRNFTKISTNVRSSFLLKAREELRRQSLTEQNSIIRRSYVTEESTERLYYRSELNDI